MAKAEIAEQLTTILVVVAIIVVGSIIYDRVHAYHQTNAYKQESCIRAAQEANKKATYTDLWLKLHPDPLQEDIDNCKSFYPED